VNHGLTAPARYLAPAAPDTRLIGAGALSKTGPMNLPARAGALLGLGLAFAALAPLGCEKNAPELNPEPRATVSAEPETPEPADVIQEDLVVGTGVAAQTGDKVKVNYTGRLQKTHFMFDSSLGKGKKPFEFTIGKGGAIEGWQLGIPGMKVGGKRKLTVPSRLGYADKGQPPKIPGKATLVFEVELLSVNEAPDGGADAAAPDAGPKKK
jgi:FKBP-type peptidyl-prolyl cis-trans isomerase FkpA